MTAEREAGKMTGKSLKNTVFPLLGASRSEVITGPENGVDVSMVNLGNGMALVMASDPLSLVPTLGLKESAWLSVHLMANDVATTGFPPQYAQFVLNLPHNLSQKDFATYWEFIDEFCRSLNVAITGGHTGRFEGQNATVCGGGTMAAVVPVERVLTSKGAKPGDLLFVTKASALAATSILARSFPETVRRELGTRVQEEVAALFYETSAVKAGTLAGELHYHTGAVAAMHDVTEGGVIGAAAELAIASKCGLKLYTDRIPVSSAQSQVCDLFELYPHHCVGAGAMLIVVKPQGAEQLKRRFAQEAIPLTEIGKMTPEGTGLVGIMNNETTELNPPDKDPYWAAFQKAFNKGWK